jgi:hypothetical protein
VTVGELPFLVRLGFYAALLASLAAADLLSDEGWVPLVVLVGFLFVVLPASVRLFGRRRGTIPRASGREIVAFAAVLTLLTAIEVAVVPDLGLGAIFWIVATLIPSFEVLGYLTRNQPRTDETVNRSE